MVWMAERLRFSQSPDGQNARTKLFGLGSAGCNMIEPATYPKVAVSTSSADLDRSGAERRILLGQDRLVGAYHTDRSVLKQMPSIVGHEVMDLFNNTDLAFLMCGLGGISGSLGTKVFSTLAQSKGTLEIVLAATPFSAESTRRREFAKRILGELLETSAVCVEFGNDQLSTLAPNVPLSKAFSLMNSIMLRPVMELCATASKLDIGPLGRVIGDSSYGRFGLGMARGDERVERVVDEALSSPWFDYDLAETDAGIVIYSSSDPWDKEMESILGSLDSHLPRCRMICGSYADPALGDRIRLSLILCRTL